MSKFTKHLFTIFKHKLYVFKYCKKADIVWRGLVHDLSKFHPVEFLESVKYADGKISPIVKCKEKNGVSYAWLHHKGANPHHYEYWQDNFDVGGQPIKMPFKYALEQVCDYLGAGQAYLGKEFSYKREYDWWLAKKARPLAMHPQTILFTDLLLSQIYQENSLDVLKQERSSEIYIIANKLYEEFGEGICNMNSDTSICDHDWHRPLEDSPYCDQVCASLPPKYQWTCSKCGKVIYRECSLGKPKSSEYND